MENKNPILDEMYLQQPQQMHHLARHEKRFLNNLIDSLVMSGMTRLIEFVLMKFYAWEPSEELTPENILTSLLMGLSLTIAYYCTMEGFCNGRTIGKFLTKTKVVDINGQAPDFSSVLIRSLSRLVPFEALSFLGKDPIGWHDKWSKTRVVEDKTTFDA
ncbi:MAG: RDD family protein [Saprospiraceae bacterium]|nr:RDD family protein [Saprospiraceae bacterium]